MFYTLRPEIYKLFVTLSQIIRCTSFETMIFNFIALKLELGDVV